MADIPPNISSSAAQAGYVQSEAARARDAARAGQRAAQQNQTKAIEEADAAITADDDDVQIYADSEGTGSQGRELPADADTEDAESEAPTDASGITRDDDGNPHLDIQA